MAFHVVSSFLMRVFRNHKIEAPDWLLKNSSHSEGGFWSTRNKKEDTTWKAMKNWTRKCYIFLPLILRSLGHFERRVAPWTTTLFWINGIHFVVPFFMAFHAVSSFLLRVLASKTTLWMAGIFQQPIRCFYFMVFEANTRSKKGGHHMEGHEKLGQKMLHFLVYH